MSWSSFDGHKSLLLSPFLVIKLAEEVVGMWESRFGLSQVIVGKVENLL